MDVVHCVDAYHLLHPAPPPIGFAGHPNVSVHGLQSGYRALSPLLTQQTGRPWLKMRRIAELVRSRAYDVVHYHNISLLGPGALGIEPAVLHLTLTATTDAATFVNLAHHGYWNLDGSAPEDVAGLTVQEAKPGSAPKLLFSAMDASVAGEIEQAFAKLKTLAGSWVGQLSTFPSSPEHDGSFAQFAMRVTSRGNALAHELSLAGIPDHPLSMFYIDDDDLDTLLSIFSDCVRSEASWTGRGRGRYRRVYPQRRPDRLVP